MPTRYLCVSRPRQQGMATLVTAVVLLIAALGVLFYMSDVVNRETQLVANEYRGKQAFHAAQGGIDRGMYELQQASGSLPASRAFDAASYGYTADVVSDANPDFVILKSEGYSDDASVQRVVFQVLSKNPIFPSIATIPLVAKGNASLSGSFELINNDENINVWTGGSVSKSGAFATKISIGGVDNQISTTKNTIGPDVVHNDLSLANASSEEILESFTGYNLSELKELAGSNVYSSELGSAEDFAAALSDSSTGVIYYNDPSNAAASFGLPAGSPSTNIIGSEDNPVILVVDGTLNIQANCTFYGVIISAGEIEKINGGPYIYGGIIGLDEVDLGNGNFTIENSPGVSNGLQNKFELSFVDGGWRDWE